MALILIVDDQDLEAGETRLGRRLSCILHRAFTSALDDPRCPWAKAGTPLGPCAPTPVFLTYRTRRGHDAGRARFTLPRGLASLQQAVRSGHSDPQVYYAEAP